MLSGMSFPTTVLPLLFKISQPSFSRQSQVASISAECAMPLITLSEDSAAQISERCAILFEGGAATLPSARLFLTVTVIFFANMPCQNVNGFGISRNTVPRNGIYTGGADITYLTEIFTF